MHFNCALDLVICHLIIQRVICCISNKYLCWITLYIMHWKSICLNKCFTISKFSYNFSSFQQSATKSFTLFFHLLIASNCTLLHIISEAHFFLKLKIIPIDQLNSKLNNYIPRNTKVWELRYNHVRNYNRFESQNP